MLNIFRNHLNSGQKGFWRKTLIKSFPTHTGKCFTFKYFKSKECTKGCMISRCIFEFQIPIMYVVYLESPCLQFITWCTKFLVWFLIYYKTCLFFQTFRWRTQDVFGRKVCYDRNENLYVQIHLQVQNWKSLRYQTHLFEWRHIHELLREHDCEIESSEIKIYCNGFKFSFLNDTF